MELWGSIVLYSFVAYLFIHLVLEDVVHVYKVLFEINHQAHTSQPSPRNLPAQEGEGDVHVIDGRSISIGDIEQAEPRNGPIFQASENTLSITQTETKQDSSDTEQKQSESGHIDTAAAPTTHFYKLQKKHIQNSEQYSAILQQKQRQSSVIILFYKLADITLACVMGYFHVFQVCWVACLSCLQVVLLRYIDFLQDLTRTLTDKEVVKYTAGSAVLCLAIACTTICVLFTIKY